MLAQHKQMKTGSVGFQKHHQVQYNNGTFLSQPLTRSSFTESTLINDQITTAASTDSCLLNHGSLNEQSGESTTHELLTATQHAQSNGFNCSEFTDQETADRSETTDLRFTDDLKAQLIESSASKFTDREQTDLLIVDRTIVCSKNPDQAIADSGASNLQINNQELAEHRALVVRATDQDLLSKKDLRLEHDQLEHSRSETTGSKKFAREVTDLKSADPEDGSILLVNENDSSSQLSSRKNCDLEFSQTASLQKNSVHSEITATRTAGHFSSRDSETRTLKNFEGDQRSNKEFLKFLLPATLENREASSRLQERDLSLPIREQNNFLKSETDPSVGEKSSECEAEKDSGLVRSHQGSLCLTDSKRGKNPLVESRGEISRSSVSYQPRDKSRLNVSEATISMLKTDFTNLFAETRAKNPKDLYDLNFLNLNELLESPFLFSGEGRRLLEEFLESDLKNNKYLKDGLKSTNGPLEEHLLLLVMMSEVLASLDLDRVVRGNIRGRDGLYSDRKSKRRVISPQGAKIRINQFLREYDLETLNQNYSCYSLVIASDENLQGRVTDCEQAKDLFENFFDRNRSVLRSLVKKKRIKAFYMSHEISVKSIRDSSFFPHSHVLVWTEDSTLPSSLDFAPLSIKVDEKPLSMVGMKRMLSYMLKAGSLSRAYRNEFSEQNRREFNLQAKECFYTFYRLNYGDQLKKGKQMIAKSGVRKLEEYKSKKNRKKSGQKAQRRV